MTQKIPAIIARPAAGVLSLALWTAFGLQAQDAAPKAVISNGPVRAEVQLPDREHGSYLGTRFDWAGIVSRLQFAGHEYVAQWHTYRGPLVHDDVTGPAEEFLTNEKTNESALGYEDTPAGGTFPRIGIGMLRKPAGETTYHRYVTYDIADHGQWTIHKGKDRVEFIHRLGSSNGYAYVYRKTVLLPKGRTGLEIRHALKNTGSKTIDTVQYSHNFFVMDQQVVGPEMLVRFGFVPKTSRELPFGAGVRGQEIFYSRELQTGQTSSADIAGFRDDAKDYDIRVENRQAGTGVRITSDRPLAQLHFWSVRNVACPEPYVHVNVPPGQERTWTLRYDLYTIPASGTAH